jgi:hypothetical protein
VDLVPSPKCTFLRPKCEKTNINIEKTLAMQCYMFRFKCSTYIQLFFENIRININSTTHNLSLNINLKKCNKWQFQNDPQPRPQGLWGKMRRAAKALVKAGEIIHKLWIILSRDISEQMLYRGGTGGQFVWACAKKINMATYIRSASWIYLVLKLIKQHFNERKLCNI